MTNGLFLTLHYFVSNDISTYFQLALYLFYITLNFVQNKSIIIITTEFFLERKMSHVTLLALTIDYTATGHRVSWSRRDFDWRWRRAATTETGGVVAVGVVAAVDAVREAPHWTVAVDRASPESRWYDSTGWLSCRRSTAGGRPEIYPPNDTTYTVT